MDALVRMYVSNTPRTSRVFADGFGASLPATGEHFYSSWYGRCRMRTSLQPLE